MGKVWWVGLGGFLGSVLRYGIGTLIARAKGGWAFPLETLVINVAGCFVAGIFAGLIESRVGFSPSARAFLFVGLLGGFTTFSAFGNETFQLLRAGHWPYAALSTALQLALGVGSLWAGFELVRLARVAAPMG
jgi:CrcB protein